MFTRKGAVPGAEASVPVRNHLGRSWRSVAGSVPIRHAWGHPMWTTRNRARCDRSRLRCPGGLTDAEWALVTPLVPPARHGGSKADGGRARGCQRPHACAGHRLPVAGDPPGTWPRAAPPSATRRAGTGTAPWGASTTRPMCNAARWPGARPARQRPSLKAGDVMMPGSGVSAAAGPG